MPRSTNPSVRVKIDLRLVRLRLQGADLRIERLHLQRELLVADRRRSPGRVATAIAFPDVSWTMVPPMRPARRHDADALDRRKHRLLVGDDRGAHGEDFCSRPEPRSAPPPR